MLCGAKIMVTDVLLWLNKTQIFQEFIIQFCGFFPQSNYEKNSPKKRVVQRDSPTVSQGSSLWTQKSVLERENKTREKQKQMLDNRKANQMRSILFPQHSKEIKKRANGGSISDFSPVNLIYVSSKRFRDLKNVSNNAQTPNFAVKSQRSYDEQTFLIISSMNKLIYDIYIHFITIVIYT